MSAQSDHSKPDDSSPPGAAIAAPLAGHTLEMTQIGKYHTAGGHGFAAGGMAHSQHEKFPWTIGNFGHTLPAMQKPPIYIDLFAGCGGLSVGLYKAGWRGLFAVERDPNAFSTLSENLIKMRKHFDWPEWLEVGPWDIKQLITQKQESLVQLRGKVDLVVGGPPCQGFSTAGRRKETDSRNALMDSYLDFVSAVQPRAIMFENVKGFTMRFCANGGGDTAYSQRVIEGLQKLGYEDALGQVIDASQYGIPQKRLRYIAIATRKNKAASVFESLERDRNQFLSSRGLPFYSTSRSAISDLEHAHGTVPSPDTSGFRAGLKGRATTGLQKYLRAGQKQRLPDSHRFVNHTSTVKSIFESLIGSAPRNICIAGEAREKYKLKKRSVTVLCPGQPAPTITTIPDDFIHYSEPRVMTARECARLQTFPDWFMFHGPYTTGGKQRSRQTPRYSQIGNAVPPLLAEQLGLALKETLNE